MTPTTVHGKSCLLAPMLLLVLFYLASQVKDTTGLSVEAKGHLSNRAASAASLRSESAAAANKHAYLMRRRRSMKGGLWGPPPYNAYFADGTRDASASPSKRNEEAWIWMPAYGYVPMPTDDGASKDQERSGDRIGNLLRYG